MTVFSIALLFTLTLLASTATIVAMLVTRWDAIMAALAGEPVPERRSLPVVSRRVAHMRAQRHSFGSGPSRQQLQRAAA